MLINSVMKEKLEAIRKYNLWNGETLSTGVPRTLYIEKIAEFIGSRLVKVLIGQRRSGKSIILRQIMNELLHRGIPSSNILFISKEFIEYDFIEEYRTLEEFYQLYLSTFTPQGKVYLFIDEIQNTADWEKFVNSHSQDFR